MPADQNVPAKTNSPAAESAALGAGASAPSATPLTGETTVGDKGGYLAELVAYQALRRAAQDAAAQIGERLVMPKEQVGILIVDTLDLAAHAAVLELAKQRLAWISATLQAQVSANQSLSAAPAPAKPQEPVITEGTILEIAPAALVAALPGLVSALGSASSAVAAAGGLVSALAGVAAFFRNDSTVTSRAIVLQQDAAKSLMAHALGNYATYIADFRPVSDSALLTDLGRLIRLRLELAQSMGELAERASQPQSANGGATKAELDAAVTSSMALAAVADEFVKELTTTGNADAAPLLAQSLAAEQLRDACYTHYLYVHIATSGGDIMTEKSLWRSSQTTYLGGGVLNYVLIDRNGRIVAADTLPAFSELATRGGKLVVDTSASHVVR